MRSRLFITLGVLWALGVAAGPIAVVAAAPGELTEDPAAVRIEEKPEAGQRPLRRLESQLLGATPEERDRLEEERKRLSAAAAAFGTDPTAIVGFYQLEYGHNVFTNNLRLDVATATIRLPLTPNWLLQVKMPYAWADLNQPRGFTTSGTSDMVVRTGGRVYASQNVALFIGMDTSFPTASEQQLGTGKYTLGPGGGVAVPLARLRSLFFTVVENFRSVGGDPSRADLNFMQVQSGFNTIWSERWWSLASMTWAIDWNNNRKTSMTLLGEVGHRLDNHWNLFVRTGAGVVGRDTILGLDWTVQAGVRWVFRTPVIPETFLGGPFGRPTSTR